MKYFRHRLLWLVLLGAGIIFSGALVTTIVAGEGLAPDANVEVALKEGQHTEWLLSTDRPGLSGIRVWLAKPPPDEVYVAIRISDATMPEVAIVEAVAPLMQVAEDGIVDLRFAPLQGSSSPHLVTTTLIMDISARGLASDRPIVFKGGEGYAREAQVVAFVPLYEVRPLDALWPISQMARGRPGLWGWPPLYPMLIYGFLVLMMYSMWRILQAVIVDSGRRND